VRPLAIRTACGVVYGAWCMVYGAWCMVHGAWCMVHGAWCMVHGAWCMVYGAWCMVHGAWCLLYDVPYHTCMLCFFISRSNDCLFSFVLSIVPMVKGLFCVPAARAAWTM
jgi:hypothetical protein